MRFAGARQLSDQCAEILGTATAALLDQPGQHRLVAAFHSFQAALHGIAGNDGEMQPVEQVLAIDCLLQISDKAQALVQMPPDLLFIQIEAGGDRADGLAFGNPARHAPPVYQSWPLTRPGDEVGPAACRDWL